MGRKKVEHSSNQHPHDIENPDIPELVTSMQEKLEHLSDLSPHCCIYRVPERLISYGKKNAAYVPQVVSIGPLHHGAKGLEAMEEHKMRYLKAFLDRTHVPLEDYVKKIKLQDAELRGCYEETLHHGPDDFVSIILVDAVFVIEILLRSFDKGLRDQNDWIFEKPWMLQNIVPDMLLLENQLPFFILKELFDPDKINFSSNERPSILELSYKFFRMPMGLDGTEDNWKAISSPKSQVVGLERADNWEKICSEVKHFVDFIRKLHLPRNNRQRGGSTQSTLTTPSIMKLQQAGVKFKVGSSKNLFEIQFKDGTLEIPKMEIHNYTELTIRNLIAFEQCHCMDSYISDYISILDDFVNTPKDVESLVQDEIVTNTLGDNNKVSTMINSLCIGVSWNHKDYYFAALSQDLNTYCKTPYNTWKANLRQKYFNTPWAAISVVAAFILLMLTIAQTVFSILSVF